MEQKILTASSNNGTGLLTTICVAFCNLLGTESKNYKRKQKLVLERANKELMSAFKNLGPGYSLVGYRVTWSKPLCVSVSALAIKDSEESEQPVDAPAPQKAAPTCPNCGAPIEEDMLFCGECGQKLK